MTSRLPNEKPDLQGKAFPGDVIDDRDRPTIVGQPRRTLHYPGKPVNFHG
jgi:hypothetical protein